MGQTVEMQAAFVLPHREVDADVRIAFDQAHQLAGELVATPGEFGLVARTLDQAIETPYRLFPQVEHRQAPGGLLGCRPVACRLDLALVGEYAAR